MKESETSQDEGMDLELSSIASASCMRDNGKKTRSTVSVAKYSPTVHIMSADGMTMNGKEKAVSIS